MDGYRKSAKSAGLFIVAGVKMILCRFEILQMAFKNFLKKIMLKSYCLKQMKAPDE